MNILKTILFGIGLALGAGLVYALITSEVALLLTLTFGAFLLGAVVIGVALLINNRQWTQALGMRRHQTTNRYELGPPTYSSYPGQVPPFYNVPDSFPMIEGDAPLGNDEPVA